jgi:predicted nucleic acid-binding protein
MRSEEVRAAHRAWNAYVHARRSARVPRRPVADLLIGGFALNRDGLVTRNAADFQSLFPKLVIREP